MEKFQLPEEKIMHEISVNSSQVSASSLVCVSGQPEISNSSDIGIHDLATKLVFNREENYVIDDAKRALSKDA